VQYIVFEFALIVAEQAEVFDTFTIHFVDDVFEVVPFLLADAAEDFLGFFRIKRVFLEALRVGYMEPLIEANNTVGSDL